MIADAIQEKSGIEVNRRQLDFEPIRTLGRQNVHVRLTIDLVPEVGVVVYREGETLEAVLKREQEETYLEVEEEESEPEEQA